MAPPNRAPTVHVGTDDLTSDVRRGGKTWKHERTRCLPQEASRRALFLYNVHQGVLVSPASVCRPRSFARRAEEKPPSPDQTNHEFNPRETKFDPTICSLCRSAYSFIRRTSAILVLRSYDPTVAVSDTDRQVGSAFEGCPGRAPARSERLHGRRLLGGGPGTAIRPPPPERGAIRSQIATTPKSTAVIVARQRAVIAQRRAAPGCTCWLGASHAASVRVRTSRHVARAC